MVNISELITERKHSREATLFSTIVYKSVEELVDGLIENGKRFSLSKIEIPYPVFDKISREVTKNSNLPILLNSLILKTDIDYFSIMISFPQEKIISLTEVCLNQKEKLVIEYIDKTGANN